MSKRGLNYFVYTKVTIVDESDYPVSEATVYLTTTLPDDSTVSDSGITGSDGTVTFSVKSQQTGTYTSEVTDVIHASLTYDPRANVETSKSPTVPLAPTPDYYTLWWILHRSKSSLSAASGLGAAQAVSGKIQAGSGNVFTFTVDDVTLSGWTYDSLANVETTDSITVA